MNPVTFLTIAAMESEGNACNCYCGTNLQLTDLSANGPNVTSESEAVRISFAILGQFMNAMNNRTNSFKLTATSWNDVSICGSSGTVQPFGDCDNFPVASNPSCYGEGAYKIASAYSSCWINPNTGQASSLY